MNVISADTKISTLIKENPACIDVIAAINPHFRKLQNPFLRKILASRVTIREAAKIGRCGLNDFFDKLKPLGFIIDYSRQDQDDKKTSAIPGHFDKTIDVRQDIDSGQDPFSKIMKEVDALAKGEVLLLINSFEPIPLIRILSKKGFKTEVQEVSDNEVYIYITGVGHIKEPDAVFLSTNILFQKKLGEYAGCIVTLNVRQLPMPQPMLLILETLTQLPDDEVLHVYHKKIPMFLIPELEEKGFSYIICETGEGIEMLIFKKTIKDVSA